MRRTSLCLAVVISVFWFGGTQAAAQNRVVIVGSGSNVPVSLYEAWTTEFNKRNPDVQVQYIALGTSESLKQISEGSGDFGGGEVPLTREQMHGSKLELKQIPTVLVGIVPIYNLPGSPELNFSGDLLAQIFLGSVKNWNDPRVAQLNPDVELPRLAISVVHRSPGKGSNYIFTDFLSKTSPQFRSGVGTSPSPHWPIGTDANRGQDMVEKVAATRGAIGYVEVNFVRGSNVEYGRVRNSAGRFVRATPASIEAACAATAGHLPSDFRVSMTNAPGADSYPLSSFTWIYVPTSASPERGAALKQFLTWALRDGRDIAKNLGYAPLPPHITAKALAVVNSSN